MLSGAAFAFAGRTSLWPEFAEAQALVPGKERLIVPSLRFYDLETPANLFDSWITPVNLFFVRNHMSEPTSFDADAYRLKVSGDVEHPLELSLADLRKLERGRCHAIHYQWQAHPGVHHSEWLFRIPGQRHDDGSRAVHGSGFRLLDPSGCPY